MLLLLNPLTPAQAWPTTAFLSHYWRRPVPIGGASPPHWPAFETALSARACGQCHIEQYRQWRTSRHALAMGPGVMGQLAQAGLGHWAFVRGCLSCHAPARAQWHQVRAALAGRPLAALARQGVTCADCHVRHYRRFGPPLAPYLADGRVIHGGFTPSRDFTRSRFCISCHQFHRNGARLDGSLLENVYGEWRKSRYARAGVTCQSCHMPDGRHDFYGIHNPRFVRRALTIRFRAGPAPSGRAITARLVITNSGVGHDFPTYTTPEVVAALWQRCATHICRGTLRRLVIGRRISLNLKHQYFDTRIKAGQSRTLSYDVARAPKATGLAARITVYPDAAYVRFFRAYLVRYRLTAAERHTIRQALLRDEHSSYVLWQANRPVPRR
ncbi:multiheme c-type cytochrome [Acidiferrobacter sp.]|uniref:multiheme c-type cytochrome n=1 Tax=Acidiferrobacter sp. TaxID=1872107 RepID=UPI0026137DA5|nr:multiheme c-type cytochrome [Acidiferrobacter sp.]